MKDTGVVRRIDELGRVVIPKEIRKTMRIKEGDALEIFTEGESVILKKYSQVGAIAKNAGELALAIEEVTGSCCLIFDTDNIIAVSGKKFSKLFKAKLSKNLFEIIKARREFIQDKSTNVGKVAEMFADSDIKSAFILPIVSGGDVYGGLCLLSTESNLSSDKMMVARSGANFLCKSIE